MKRLKCNECGTRMIITIEPTLHESGFIDTIWLCEKCGYVYCETQFADEEPVQLGLPLFENG